MNKMGRVLHSINQVLKDKVFLIFTSLVWIRSQTHILGRRSAHWQDHCFKYNMPGSFRSSPAPHHPCGYPGIAETVLQ